MAAEHDQAEEAGAQRIPRHAAPLSQVSAAEDKQRQQGQHGAPEMNDENALEDTDPLCHQAGQRACSPTATPPARPTRMIRMIDCMRFPLLAVLELSGRCRARIALRLEAEVFQPCPSFPFLAPSSSFQNASS